MSRHGATPRHRNARKRARQQSLRCGARLKRVSYISTTACSGLFIYEQQALIFRKSIRSREHRRSYCAANPGRQCSWRYSAYICMDRAPYRTIATGVSCHAARASDRKMVPHRLDLETLCCSMGLRRKLVPLPLLLQVATMAATKAVAVKKGITP